MKPKTSIFVCKETNLKLFKKIKIIDNYFKKLSKIVICLDC